MKKALIAISVVALLGLTSAFAYADGIPAKEEEPEGIEIENREFRPCCHGYGQGHRHGYGRRMGIR